MTSALALSAPHPGAAFEKGTIERRELRPDDVLIVNRPGFRSVLEARKTNRNNQIALSGLCRQGTADPCHATVR